MFLRRSILFKSEQVRGFDDAEALRTLYVF